MSLKLAMWKHLLAIQILIAAFNCIYQYLWLHISVDCLLYSRHYTGLQETQQFIMNFLFFYALVNYLPDKVWCLMSLSPTHGVVHIMVSPTYLVQQWNLCVCARARMYTCTHAHTHTHTQETIMQQCLWSLLVNILYFLSILILKSIKC